MAASGPPGRWQASDGFAIVVVLLALALLSLIAATFSIAVRTHLRDVAAATASARAEAHADGGVSVVLADLLAVRENRTLSRRFPLDGSEVVCAPRSGVRLFIRVQDEAGRVDLNTASEALLLALLRGYGVESDAASRIADRLIDNRDRDSDRRPNGAERADYEAAGVPGPKNAPLDAIDELAQVLGLDAALVDRLRPAVTVHSGLAGVDPRVMPAERAAAIARGFAISAASLPEVGRPGDRGGLPSRLVDLSPQQVFAIRVVAVTDDGARFARDAVVDLGPRRAQQHVFRRWSRSNVQATEPAANAGAILSAPASPC